MPLMPTQPVEAGQVRLVSGDREGHVSDRLLDRVAIVTGTARGVGAAIAEVFAHQGAIVVGIDINGARGRAAAERLIADGGRAEFVEGDVTNERTVLDLVEHVSRTYGRIDTLVCNAVYQREARLLDATKEDFDRHVSVNLLAPFLLSRAVLPVMLGQHRGSLIFMSSLLGLAADPILPVYGMTKTGILGLMRSIAITYGPDGVRSNAICPGDIDTELNQGYFARAEDPVAARARVEGLYPMRRIAQPEEVANVALFLASDDSSFVSGTELVVDGGFRALCYDLQADPT